MKEDGKGFWSDWSEEASGITYEDRPSKAPSFWYKIEPSHTHGYRSVQLIWKVKNCMFMFFYHLHKYILYGIVSVVF